MQSHRPDPIPHYRSLAAYFDGHGSGLSSWVWFNFVVRGWVSSWVFLVVRGWVSSMGLFSGSVGVARFWWVCDLIMGGKGSDLWGLWPGGGDGDSGFGCLFCFWFGGL